MTVEILIDDNGSAVVSARGTDANETLRLHKLYTDLLSGVEVAKATMEERERCAKIASSIGSDLRNPDRARIAAAKIADAIRGTSSS